MENIKGGRSLPVPQLLTMASAEKTRKGFLLNHLSCSPDDPVGQGTELN